jgi:hypothetical protein
VCAAPENLRVVDAAFDGRGATNAPNNRAMKALCASCTIWDDCLRDALENGEHGPWGGTVERERTKVTGQRPYRFNMRDVEYPHVAYMHSAVPGERRNPETRQIKEWAVGVGLLAAVTRGTVRREIREAYYAAHPEPAC